MATTTTTPGVQYSGIWTMNQVNAALAAGTWTGIITNPLFSWGQGSNGKLGLGNITDYSSPKQVGSLTTWLKAAGGTYSMISVKKDGTLWTWGGNASGQLGLGNTTSYSSPKQVGALTTWLNIAGGYRCTIAVKTDGTLWTWGRNNLGQLGQGNTTNQSSPVQVGVLTSWLNVTSGGYAFAIATKTDGTLWTWGQNTNGQLGQGNTTNRSSPVQVGALTNWLNIASGQYHAISIKTDGTLWTWGFNNNGQLGLGNTTYYSSPKQVGSLTNWSSAAGGNYSCMVVKTDGTLWSWGRNQFGQLGLGTSGPGTYRSSPNQVGALTTWANVGAGPNFFFAVPNAST